MYEYNAQLVHVVDGDTMDFDIDLGFKIKHKVRVRLYGIDTPEIFHPENEVEKMHGRAAKEFVEKFISLQGILHTRKDHKGKYGRYIADFFFNIDGREVSLCDHLKENGYAKRKTYLQEC